MRTWNPVKMSKEIRGEVEVGRGDMGVEKGIGRGELQQYNNDHNCFNESQDNIVLSSLGEENLHKTYNFETMPLKQIFVTKDNFLNLSHISIKKKRQ